MNMMVLSNGSWADNTNLANYAPIYCGSGLVQGNTRGVDDKAFCQSPIRTVLAITSKFYKPTRLGHRDVGRLGEVPLAHFSSHSDFR
jgi:hypothetical protein